MFASEITNTSAAVRELVNASGSPNMSDILLRLNKNNPSFQHPNMMRLFTLCFIVFISETAHLFAMAKHTFVNGLSTGLFRRIEQRLSIVHALFIGIILGFVTLAQVSFEADEGMLYCPDSCRFVNKVRIYFLTLSSYMLVIIVVMCYSVVVKPLFSPPTRISKLLTIGAVFYALCSVPSFILATLQYLFETDAPCIPYPFTTMQYSRIPERIGMVVVLFITYIIPLSLVLFIFIKILNNLQAKGSQIKHSVTDANFVRMTSMMSLAFIITNTPLILQEIIVIFFDSSLVNPNLVIFVEICSVMNITINPCIYLWIDCRYSHWDCPICPMGVVTISNNNERGLYKCCYEPVSKDGKKSCLVKPILALPAKE